MIRHTSPGFDAPDALHVTAELDNRPDMMAAAIKVSVAALRPNVAKRLGYEGVAVCQNCTDRLIAIKNGDPWVHRRTGERECERALFREGSSRIKARGGSV